MTTSFQGLTAAPFTALNADGALNLAAIERQAEHLARDGVQGAFVCGTTGEGSSLTLDERMHVAERWTTVCGDRLRVIVHVGHNCQADACVLSAHARSLGASGVGAISPSFLKPATADDLAAFIAPIAAACHPLPFFYYHIPVFSGVHIPASEVLAAAADIPNLAGVKFTDEALADFEACARMDGGRFTALFGRDELLLAGLSLGASGAVGSTYNFAAPIYLRLIAAFQSGDLAKATMIQERATRFVSIIYGEFGGIPAAKALMKVLGIDCGPARSPLRSLTPARTEEMVRALTEAGFFDALEQ